MKINIIGGGPAGLYFSILVKKLRPEADIQVYERNRPDDTFGFGVVFSDETLGNFRDADPESYQSIIRNFAYWDEIDTYYGGTMLRSTGHGFCGMSRLLLLQLLQQRAEALGVQISYETDISDPDAYRDCDLMLAADGVNSLIRDKYAQSFLPDVEMKQNKFIWLGSAAPLDAFTFIFKENQHGPWIVHAYRFRDEVATWIIETTPEAFAAAGLENATEEESVAYLQDVFADELKGYPLLTNRSIWRNFPAIHCESWVHENVVILGDAAHTAHFSIGSGTKLAMEDAIALKDALVQNNWSVPEALTAYDHDRREEVGKIQHAANVSLAWFENVPRYMEMAPEQFKFSMMSRSKQVTFENLRMRDPELIEKVTAWFAAEGRRAGFDVDDTTPPMFVPFRLRDMVVSNRVVVSPMCQYSATDGVPDDWHLVHYGSRALGGAGLLYTEMTNVSDDARISPGCTGIWNDEQMAAWKRIVGFVHAQGDTKFAIQLGHAGRKGSTKLAWDGTDEPLESGNWPVIAPSAIPYTGDNQMPTAMSDADMDRVVADFVAAANRADQAGFDMLEVHMAHGYLLATFISPLTNRRTDGYGGSIENRMKFPLRVFEAVRATWPESKPMAVRISATDWKEGGLSDDDAIAAARMLAAAGCDLIDVSAGQTVADQQPVYGRMFQVPFADMIRHEADIATIAVGNITSGDQVNTIVASGRADLVALDRPHLADPYFTLHAAAEQGYAGTQWPKQYAAGGLQSFRQAEKDRGEMAELRLMARPMKPQDELDG